MRCPFLREAEVRSCEAAPFRKLLRTQGGTDGSGPCATPAWTRCTWAVARGGDASSTSPVCPFLRTSEVLYCDASSVRCFVPYSDSVTSCCQGEGHAYCDLYLSLARPVRASGAAPEAAGTDVAIVDGVAVPRRLAYAPNHLWLDLREDDTCHIGVDAFLARTLGRVESVEFVQARGTCRPTVVLSVHGTDVRLAFPNAIHVLHANPALRAEPSRIVDDPYGRGWVFSGRESCGSSAPNDAGGARYGLKTGEDAVAWMREEADRLSRFVHAAAARPGPDGLRLPNDGGSPAPGVAGVLTRADRLELVDEFFTLQTEARRS